MVATKENPKSTAMDYLSAPRSEGLVVSLLSLLGFTAPENGRLPAGVKYDTIVALHDVFSISEIASVFAPDSFCCFSKSSLSLRCSVISLATIRSLSTLPFSINGE